MEETYELNESMKEEDICKILQERGELTIEELGIDKDDEIFNTFYHKIHGGAAIGISCRRKRVNPALSISVYGNKQEIEDTKNLLKRLNLIHRAY